VAVENAAARSAPRAAAGAPEAGTLLSSIIILFFAFLGETCQKPKGLNYYVSAILTNILLSSCRVSEWRNCTRKCSERIFGHEIFPPKWISYHSISQLLPVLS
jgi:hypothetical protein